jgi:CRP/FNR family transcriptional regulator, cyclic AMP receptor protein
MRGSGSSAMLTTPPLLRVGDPNPSHRHVRMPNPLGFVRLCSEEVRLAKAKLDAVIATVPLFDSLSKRHLKKVAGLTSTVEYNAGDTVIQEGEPGDSFFVAVSGQAKVVSGGKTLHRLIPGDHFGEISLLDGRPRSASVVAETPLSLLQLPRTSFLRLVKDDADLARALLASLARMVRRVDRSLAR